MTTSTANLSEVAARASRAAKPMRLASIATRAGWLRAVADALDARVDDLVELAVAETHLEPGRLASELARTTNQLRFFATVIEEGSFLEIIVDDADRLANPPRPELRRILVGVGPVAVFAASNFPFAFSVCGGDTASALAAGNPVIVKAHSGHPGLSRLTARVAVDALTAAGAPDGALALIEGRDAGNQLVQRSEIRAVGFTGSVKGGRALFDIAAARPDPIPFFGELGSLNPVVITEGAAAARGAEIAEGWIASFTTGSGQLCTKPGYVFFPRDADIEQTLRTKLAAVEGGLLLTDRIQEAFSAGVDDLSSDGFAEVVAQGVSTGSGARPVILRVEAEQIVQDPDGFLIELFGPATVLVRYDSLAQLNFVLRFVPPGLTATIHSEPLEDVGETLEILQDRAGRLIFNDWPTGVAVGWAQHHGGPWPATTSQFTSVGSTAIRRFLRPLVFQGAPPELLPASLTDASVGDIPHRRNGVLRLPESGKRLGNALTVERPKRDN